ncbi:unnamed protein product, partial [Polarella glacialis]
APEQLLTLYADLPLESAATDIYRLAGIALTAFRSSSPQGFGSMPAEPSDVESVDTIRRLCHSAFLRRAHAQAVASAGEGAGGRLQSREEAEQEVALFSSALERLLS